MELLSLIWLRKNKKQENGGGGGGGGNLYLHMFILALSLKIPEVH